MAKEKKYKPRVVVFGCHWGAFPPLEGAKIGSSVDIRTARLMCGGRLSVGLLLRAFELGADGVIVLACDERECHYGFGASKAKEEFEIARRMGRLLGLEDERLAYREVYSGDHEKTRKEIKDFVAGVSRLGSSSTVLKEV